MVAAPAPAAATPSTPGLPPAGAGSGLIDATAASRAAAKGDASAVGGGDSGGYSGGGGAGGGGAGAAGTVDPEDRPHEYDKGSVLALCELLAVLLRRWGTGANAANPVMQVKSFLFLLETLGTSTAGIDVDQTVRGSFFYILFGNHWGVNH